MAGRIVCLMGPTASGKTALAVHLASKYCFEIISVDSALVYKGLEIGAAKPTEAELAIAPHSLISFLDPVESYSVSRFRCDAIAQIKAIWARGNTPLLVGGTMLYFRALLLGLSDLPEADVAVRAEIDTLAAAKGWTHIHQLLQQCDPVTAARLKLGDTQRLQRALEVYRLTGRPISEFQVQAADHQTSAPDYMPDIGPEPLQIALMPDDRTVLHQRIERRLQQMFADGFVDEVKSLYGHPGLSANTASMRAVGYRQVWAYLDGDYDYDQMVYRALVATRQLAKRQLTWLRKWQGLQRFLCDADNEYIVSGEYAGEMVFDAVELFLNAKLNIKPRFSV